MKRIRFTYSRNSFLNILPTRTHKTKNVGFELVKEDEPELDTRIKQVRRLPGNNSNALKLIFMENMF